MIKERLHNFFQRYNSFKDVNNDADRIELFTMHNEHFPQSKEVNRNCSGCRARMFKKMEGVYNDLISEDTDSDDYGITTIGEYLNDRPQLIGTPRKEPIRKSEPEPIRKSEPELPNPDLKTVRQVIIDSYTMHLFKKHCPVEHYEELITDIEQIITRCNDLK